MVSKPRAVSAPASAQVSSNVRRSLALALPPSLRGTAHWEGAAFVNDYEDTVAGKKTQWRDSFTFTPTSHTLVAAMERAMEP